MEQIKTIQVGENTYTIGAEQEKTDSASAIKREKVSKKFKADGWGYPEVAVLMRPNILYEIANDSEDDLDVNAVAVPLEYYNQPGTLYATNGGFGIFHENDTEIEGYPYKILMVDYCMERGCEVFFSYNPMTTEYTDGCSVLIRNTSMYVEIPYGLMEVNPIENDVPNFFFSPDAFHTEYNKIVYYAGYYDLAKIEQSSDVPNHPYKLDLWYWDEAEIGQGNFTMYLSTLDEGIVTRHFLDSDVPEPEICVGVMDSALFEIPDTTNVSCYYLHCHNIKPDCIRLHCDCYWGASFGKLYGEKLDEYANNGLELIVPSCDIKIKDGLATLEDVLILN